MHLPFFAAAADGLFAEHGLEVELVESAAGFQRVKQLAEGAGDFLLTATLYHLQAIAESGPLPVGAVAAIHQRSPIAAVVRSDSPLLAPPDLAGRRLGTFVGKQMGWLGVELGASLRAAGLGEPVAIDVSNTSPPAALAHGDVDLIANFADLLPVDQRRGGVPLRAIPVGADVYASGLLAADRVPADTIDRFVAATAASFHLQRDDPWRGVAALRARYPGVDSEVAVDTWRTLEPFAFPGGDRVGAPMDKAGWERTIRWTAQTHDLPVVPVDQMVRAERAGQAGGGDRRAAPSRPLPGPLRHGSRRARRAQ